MNPFPDLTGLPYCYICTKYFRADTDRTAFTLEQEEWRGNRKRVHYCDATFLENTPFKERLSWASFYRLIIHDLSSQTYRLSGVAQFTNPHHFVISVPKDSTRVAIGTPYLRNGKMEHIHLDDFVRNAGREQPPQAVYPVHMRCWELVRRLIGPNAEKRLDFLVTVMRQQYTNQWPLAMLNPSRYDPTYMRRLIEEFNTNKVWNRRVYGIRANAPAWMSQLPLEIIQMIMDSLSLWDIKNMRIAHGLPVDARYFRHRTPKHLFFELHDYPVDEVNWEDFCFVLGQLNHNSRFVRSRHEIKPRLDAIVSGFSTLHRHAYGQ